MVFSRLRARMMGPIDPSETALRGWGGRTRTSEWRNQNPAISPVLSMLILKNNPNSTDYLSIG